MGKRGPKPIRETTTHIRVPVSIAEVLRKAANASNVTIAVLLEHNKDKLLDFLPMPPHQGPPLPRKMGIKWRGRGKKRS